MTGSLLIVAIDLLILGGLSLLGGLVVRAILGRTDRFVLLNLSPGVGAGVISWCMFVASWAGLRLTEGTSLGLYAALVLVAALVAWRTARSVSIEKPSPNEPRGRLDLWLTRGLWILIGSLIVTTAFLAVGLSYFGWDDISNWVVKGYGIALEGSIFAGMHWGAVGLSYPMNTTLVVTLFRILDGDILPGSKLVYPIFFASLLIGCYRFWVMHGLRRWIAALGALLLATTPILFTHAYMGYANLPFTFYLVMGLLWCIDGMKEGEARKTLLGSVLLALALWTRPEGVVMGIAVVISLWLARLLTSQGRLRLPYLLLPGLIVGGGWFIFLGAQPNPSATSYSIVGLALRGLLAGQFHWSALSTIFRFIAGQVLRFRDWGFLPLLMGLLLIAGLRWRKLREDPAIAALLFATLTLGLVLFGFQYSAAFTPRGLDFVYEWLSKEFTRLIMPAFASLTLLGFLCIKDLSVGAKDTSLRAPRSVDSNSL